MAEYDYYFSLENVKQNNDDTSNLPQSAPHTSKSWSWSLASRLLHTAIKEAKSNQSIDQSTNESSKQSIDQWINSYPPNESILKNRKKSIRQ